jgi:glycine cleavage system T protein (aminomethyltransferase)
MTQDSAHAPLRQTPLHRLHVELGARMVPFAGYDMPLQFKQGILHEHLHTRSAAGLFDVSHMGQINLRPRSGSVRDVARDLESLVPVDILGLAQGRQRYALFTNPAGGILDDLMVVNRGDHLFLVVNAACKDADEAHLRAHLKHSVIEPLDRALLALQGPGAEAALARLAPDVAAMRFMDCRVVSLLGAECSVSRSGYTGEDGFEISVANDRAEALARAFLADPAVAPIGLGARDSLRLEAGLCLYGSDLDATTTPVEAALEWALQKGRRRGGARAGGFPGAEIVLTQLLSGAPRRRVGLRPEGRAPVRGGAKLFADPLSPLAVGFVSSGVFGPSVGAPVAMGYVATEYAAIGRQLYAELRGKRVAVCVSEMPFVPSRYKRN